MIFSPCKPISVPKRLIYSSGGQSHMFSTQSGEILGYIKYKSIRDFGDKFKDNAGSKSLYVNDLFVPESCRGQGVGRALINNAKRASMKNGADGNLHLVAYNVDHPGKPPHKFYRKLGFTTGVKEYDAIIDEAIKNNEPIPAMFTQGTDMFFRNI